MHTNNKQQAGKGGRLKPPHLISQHTLSVCLALSTTKHNFPAAAWYFLTRESSRTVNNGTIHGHRANLGHEVGPSQLQVLLHPSHQLHALLAHTIQHALLPLAL